MHLGGAVEREERLFRISLLERDKKGVFVGPIVKVMTGEEIIVAFCGVGDKLCRVFFHEEGMALSSLERVLLANRIPFA